MSREGIESVIGRAILNREFRQALFADAGSALAGFDLSETEKAQLQSLDREMLDSLGSILDAPISKSLLFNAPTNQKALL